MIKIALSDTIQPNQQQPNQQQPNQQQPNQQQPNQQQPNHNANALSNALCDTILPNHKALCDKGIDLTIKDRLEVLPINLITTDPLKCDLQVLNLLAICYEVDIRGLSEESARRLVNTAFIMKRYRGTVYAVKEALKAVFPNSDIKESEDKPYIFKIVLHFDSNKDLKSQFFLSSDLDSVRKAVESSKNLRSHLEGVEINLDNLNDKFVVYDGFKNEISVSGDLSVKLSQFSSLISDYRIIIDIDIDEPLSLYVDDSFSLSLYVYDSFSLEMYDIPTLISGVVTNFNISIT